jgi:uncharacterized protein YjbI with pentapeptide repeats
MPKGRKKVSPHRKPRKQKSSRSRTKDSPLRPLFDLLRPFWKWLVGLLGVAIGLLVTNYINGLPGPGSRTAKMDATLTKAWTDPNSSTRNKAFADLGNAATSADDQIFLLGRLVYLLGEHRRMKNSNCPSPPRLFGVDDQAALRTIVALSGALRQPRRRLHFFNQAPPHGLADSLHFNSLDLSFAHFDGANLQGANFSNSCLFETSFEGAILDSSDFTLARLDSPNFRDAQMRGAQLLSMTSRGGTFRSAILTGATLNSARLASVSFAGADLTCAYFANVVADNLDMTGAVMPWTLLVGDSLVRTQSWREIINLQGAYLVGVVGLTPKEIGFSRKKGAYVDGLGQEEWARSRDQNCRNRPSEKGASGAL